MPHILRHCTLIPCEVCPGALASELQQTLQLAEDRRNGCHPAKRLAGGWLAQFHGLSQSAGGQLGGHQELGFKSCQAMMDFGVLLLDYETQLVVSKRKKGATGSPWRTPSHEENKAVGPSANRRLKLADCP